MQAPKNTYKTILVITIGFLVLFLIWQKDWMLYVSIALGALAIISTFLAKWIEIIWFKIGKILGYVNSRILLSILYYIFLFPLAIISQLMGNNKLKLKKSKLDSFYTERNYTFEKKDLEKPW